MSARKRKDLDLDQQVAFLKKISFFHDFDEHELKQFLGVSKWLRVPRNTLIIKENTRERAFYILVKGEVGVFKSTSGGKKSVPLTTLHTGDCFGEMALVTEIKRTADVMAIRDSFILRVEPDIISQSSVFLQLKFYKRFCEIMVGRLDLANKRMAGGQSVPMAPSETQDLALRRGKGEPGRRKKMAAGQEKTAVRPAAARKEGESGGLPPAPTREDRVPAVKIQRRIDPDAALMVNPAVAKDVARVLLPGDGETENTRRLADLISLDPALSCRVLQTANSPFFRRASAVATVPHAMIIAGIKHVQEVVKEAVETSRELEVFEGFPELAEAFWRHGVVVGRIAALLKELIRVNLEADVYLAGLLHDLGILGLDRVNPNFYPQLLREDSEFAKDLVKAEKEYIGVDHGQAGAWIAEAIGLPQPYLDVMRFHHFPEKSNAYAMPVALVHLANLFAAERGMGLPGRTVPEDAVLRSFGWVLIQEQHRPFLDVNVMDFVQSFNEELDKTWGEVVDGLPL